MVFDWQAPRSTRIPRRLPVARSDRASTDKWSDPYGEFLAAKAATPVFALLGKKGIEQYALPATGKPLMNTLGYLMHDGPHGVIPADWPVFLDFMQQHLKP